MTGTIPKVLLIENNQTNVFIFDKVWELVHPIEDLIRLRSAQDALTYLSSGKNRKYIKVIFIEFDLPVHSGSYFLKNFEQLYCHGEVKPRVIVTTSHLSWIIIGLRRKYSFISRVMEKPIKVEYLKNLY